MMKITFVLTIFVALGAVANAASISGRNADLELEQLVIRNSIDKLKLFNEKHRLELSKFREQIKYYEVMLREVFYDDLSPKINEANDKIRAGAIEIESKTISASVDVSQCKESAQLPVNEFNSTIETMRVCLSNLLQPLDKYDDASEKIYKDGVDRLENMFTDSERYFDLESFDTAMSSMTAAGKQAASAANEIAENFTKSIERFVSESYSKTFNTYDCDPSKKLQALELEVSNVITQFDSCVQQKIEAASV